MLRKISVLLNGVMAVLGLGGLALAIANGGTGWIITTVALCGLVVAGVTNVSTLLGDRWKELEIVGGLQQGANGVCLFVGALVLIAAVRMSADGVAWMYLLNGVVLIGAPVLTGVVVRVGNGPWGMGNGRGRKDGASEMTMGA